MLEAESQGGCTFSAIKLEEVVIVALSRNSAKPLAPEGHGVWRCLAVEKLTQVELCSNAWRTEPRSKRQTCIDEVDFDTDVQPEAIHKTGSEATVVATSVPERCAWSRSSVG